MQNRYVADIGDYVKFAILRALSPGRRLGVVWWLFPDENHNKDGSHREYLQRSKEWGPFDRELFDVLATINKRQEYSLSAIENSGILPHAVFASERVPCDCLPFSERPLKRNQWLHRAKETVANCNLLFLDPDNGIASDKLKVTRRHAGKSVTIDELVCLSEKNHTIVVYHHQTFFKGGHIAEIHSLATRLRNAHLKVSGALRARPWAPRIFFILNGDDDLARRAENLGKIWAPHLMWYPEP